MNVVPVRPRARLVSEEIILIYQNTAPLPASLARWLVRV